jgi:hypothetical protein
MKTILLIFTLWSNPVIEDTIFDYYLEIGVVVPHEDNEYDKIDRPMYAILIDNKTAIEYAYKGEVKHWIRTGNFVYDDFLND